MSERGKQTKGTGDRGQGSGFRVQGSGTQPLPYSLVDVPAEFRDEAALVIRVPPGLRSKQKLLAILAEKLHFPGYFGWNWDALEECLGDLSWLPPKQRVVIVHEDLPFGAGGENRAVYLNILAAASAASSSEHPLSIVFSASLAPLLSAAHSQEPARAT